LLSDANYSEKITIGHVQPRYKIEQTKSGNLELKISTSMFHFER